MTLVEQLPAEAYLKKRHVTFDIEFHPKSETALAEARELSFPADRVLKTVLLEVGDGFAMAVIPASRRLDLRRVRHVAGDERVRLATEPEIEVAYPDYELGALPPLPGLLGMKGYIDPAVLDYKLVAFADGRRTESLMAHPRRLFWGEEVIVAPITRDLDEDLRFEGDSVSVGGDWA